MKIFSSLLFTAFLAVLFVFPAAAQTPAPYDYVELQRFSVEFGVEFSEQEVDQLMTYMVLNFNRSRRFERVFLSTDAAAQEAPARRVKISGVITKYSKGSRAARYIIGLGAGRAKLVADITITDAETGDVLLTHKADGHVYGGAFGGETGQAKGELASEIIRTMTKKGLASKTRKKF
jgi:hypothetical protein